MIGTSQLINAFGAPVCFTDTTDIFKDGSGVALYGLDYDGSDAGGASGKFGEAAIFNGSSSKITLSSTISGIKTYSFWINPDSSGNATYARRIFGDVGGTSYTNSITFDAGHGKIVYYEGTTARLSDTISYNTWSHIAFTSDGTTLNVYTNGSLSNTYTTSGFVSSINEICSTSSNRQFKGSIDQVRIFNTALTQSQVTQLYQENNSTVGTHLFGCIANYNLDGSAKESMGTTAYDGTETDITYRYDGTPTAVDFGVGGQTNTGIRYSASSSSTITTPLSNSNFTSNYSISLWVNLNNANAFQNFVGNYKSSGGYGGFTFMSRDVGSGVYKYGFIWWYNTGDFYNYVDNNDVVATSGQWAHLVLTKTSGALPILYVNGTANSLNYRNTVTDHAATTENFKIGNTLNTNLQAGSIDQVRVFSKALSSAEVGKLYGNGAGEVACAHTSTTDNVAYPIANTAYYKLDNNSKDSARSTGKFNEGAVFNGSNSYITVPTLSGFTNYNFTMSFWFNSTSTAAQYFMDFRNPIYMEFGYNVGGGAYSNTYSFIIYTGTQYAIHSSANLRDGNWHHIAVTYDGGTLKMYIDNGTPITSTPNDNTQYAHSSGNKIGASATGTSVMNGSIDQVRIYNTVLDSTDVSNLYAETVSDTSTLSFPSGKTAIATYQLDGNSTDLSGNYNGTDTNVTYAYDGAETNIEYRFGKYGQAAVFNGSSSYITSNSLPSIGTGDFTFSCWFNQNSGSSQGALFSTTTQWFAANGSVSPKVLMVTDDTVTKKGDTAYSQDTWNHAVFARESGVLKIYQNGTEVFSGAYTDSWDMTQFGIGVARAFGSRVYYFNGLIDQVRIYSSALTSSQVTQLYNEKPEVDTSNFKAVLYEGNGGTQYISNVGMDLETDGGLVWIKVRSASGYNHNLFDTIRGATYRLMSNLPNAQDSNGKLTSFDANGFSLGAGGDANPSQSMVAWVWKAGGPAVSNTDGTIASQVSANQAAGFSIVRNTGTSNYSDTIGHGLSQAPEIIIQKGLGNSVDWYVLFNIDGTGGWDYAKLNTTDAFVPENPVRFGTSSTTINNWGWTNYDMINYCWHSVAGYSKIGTYEGLGTSTVTVSDVGFKPSFIMIKNIDATANWNMYDVRRSTVVDRANKILYPNLANSEPSATNYYFDMNDSGFVVSATNHEQHNFAGRTYLYMAFK